MIEEGLDTCPVAVCDVPGGKAEGNQHSIAEGLKPAPYC